MSKMKVQEMKLEKFTALREEEQQKVQGGGSTRQDFTTIINFVIKLFN